MHKANTSYEEEQAYTFENSNEIQAETPPTEAEQKALHFFETGLFFMKLFFEINLIYFFLDHTTGFMFYLKTAFAWICGLEKAEELDIQSIHSGPRPSICSIPKGNISSWHKHCSYAAIILISLAIFVWAFFTDYRIRLI